jgi:SEC-C motif
MTPGRNDPCPCGSGRKYKHCCLKARDDVDRQWRSVREAESRYVPEIFQYALDRVGRPGIAAAWKYFCGGTVPLERAPEDPDFEQLFMIWFLFDWQKPGTALKPSTRNWPAKPVAASFLDERGLALPPLDQRAVRTALAAPISFWVVEAVTPGRSIDLRDILTGARHTVLEQSASQSVQPAGILFAKVLTFDTVSIMLGAGHWVIPPPFHNRIIDVRQRWAAGATSLAGSQVKLRHAELVALYSAFVEELLNPAPPRLQNTDGDPLAPTRLEFELHCSQEEAVERLAPLAYGHQVDEFLEDPDRDPAGGVKYEVPWLTPGNRIHAEWENTSLGTIKVSSKKLEAEVNSERRARRLRKEIERRLRDRVLFMRQETTSVEALLRERGGPETGTSQREHEALQQRPEVRAQLREMRERHWVSWLDQPVPALDGLTPRAAAATPLGRERLHALLNEFEFRNRQLAPDERDDIGRLRQALGLD